MQPRDRFSQIVVDGLVALVAVGACIAAAHFLAWWFKP